ncbi:MAG TPA: hypothetical protein PKX92_02855 [Edaphocola sp.]|nr:hypothetical protein [Edaphocola sp.]
MYKIIITAITIILLTSCGKKNKKQYSYWKVNGVEYSSNNCSLETNNRDIVQFSLDSKYGRVFLEFYLPALPKEGRFLLVKTNAFQEYNKCILSFGINSKWYRVSELSMNYIEADFLNGKSQIKLPPTWYFNNDDQNDSVLIEAVLNEP